MSYFDSVLNVQVSLEGRAITQRGFGKPMGLFYHSFWVDLYREFGELSELVDAGVPVTHPIYLWATAVKAQEPSPPTFGIGRRTRAFTQIMTLTPAAPELGKVYSLDIGGMTATYTADADDDLDAVIDGLIAAINALNLTPVDVTAAGLPGGGPFTTLTVTTGSTGVLLAYANVKNIGIKDTTANPGSGGILADFNAVLAVDESWYGVSIDSQSEAEILALAPGIESAKKIFVPTTADTEVMSSGVTNDVASDLKTAGYARTLIMRHPKPMQYFSGALLGRQLPKQPGSSNWAWQNSLVGVDYEALGAGGRSTADLLAMDGKNCGHYTDFANQGFGVVLYGKVSGGKYIDNIIFSDWMRARTQERLLMLFLNAEKVGQTAIGIDAIANEMRGQFADGVAVGGLDPDFATVFDIPTIASIPLADLANRKASGFRARHRLAGAFNTVDPMIFTLTI